MSSTTADMVRLKSFYKDKITPDLKAKLKLKNIMQVPRIEKITLNMGVGDAAVDKKIIQMAQENLSRIAGQKAVVTYARKSIAGFKIREGWPIGVKVTLRKDRMYQFLDRLLSVAIPRTRDFRGLNPRSFDGRGNYSLGIKELPLFPEIDFDKLDKNRGLDITITTTANTNAEALELLKAFKFPFRGGDQAKLKTDSQPSNE